MRPLLRFVLARGVPFARLRSHGLSCHAPSVPAARVGRRRASLAGWPLRTALPRAQFRSTATLCRRAAERDLHGCDERTQLCSSHQQGLRRRCRCRRSGHGAGHACGIALVPVCALIRRVARLRLSLPHSRSLHTPRAPVHTHSLSARLACSRHVQTRVSFTHTALL
jgi:hypothetical protein